MRRMFNFHTTPAAGEALGLGPNLLLEYQFPFTTWRLRKKEKKIKLQFTLCL